MSENSDQLLAQAWEARRAGRLDDAKRDLTQAIDQCRNTHEQLKLAAALEALGQIERDLDHPDSARRHYEEAVALYRFENYEIGLAHALRHIADIHREQHNFAEAEPLYDHALYLYRDIPETTPLELGNAIRGLAILKDESGHYSRAKELWTEARDLYAASNVQEGENESSRRLASLEKKLSTANADSKCR